MPQPSNAIKLNRIRRTGRIEQRRQPGKPRHRRLESRQPLHRPAKLRQLIHTARQVRPPPPAAAADPTRDRARAAVRDTASRLGRMPASRSIDGPSAAVASSPGRISTSRDIGVCNSASARIEGSRLGHAAHRLAQIRTRLSASAPARPRHSSARAAARRPAAPAPAPRSMRVDCLMVSLLARIAAVLALMFSLFSRKVIASEQPLHTNVASEIWMSRSRDVMVLCSVSDPCSAILRVLECHHSCAESSAVTQSRDGISFLRAIPRGLWPWLLAALALVAAATAWVVVSLRIDRPDRVRRHRGAFQVRLDRQRARRLAAPARRRRAAALLGVPRPAGNLPGSHSRRLRIVRLHGRAGPRAADRRLAPPAHRRGPCRAELRRVPQRHRARHAHVAAARGAGDAGAQARPPGLRPVRPRVLPRQPADAGGRARAVSRHRASGRRCSSARSCGPA